MSIVLKSAGDIQSKAYVGIGYYASKRGANAEESAALGLVGVWHSALFGAVYGMAFGGAVGSAVGVVVSL